MLYQALLHGDDALLRAIARQAVKRFAGMEPGRPVGGTYYLYRTLRNLDLDGVLERLMERARTTTPGALTPLEERLERDEYESRIDQLKKEIEAEIRRRLVADRGVEAMARTLRKPLPEDVDFMHASREEMVELAQGHLPADPEAGGAPGPQAPPRPQGPARLPRTVRHSLSYGGVPAEPKFRYPAPGQARDLRHRRHLGFGGRLRPLHPASRLCHRRPVLEGAVVRVHRRHRRGDPLLRGRRRHRRGRAPGQHRGRRGVGRRPLRLRPRLRGVLEHLWPRDRPEDHRDDPGRRPQQLPRLPGLGHQGDPHRRPATCSGSTPSPGPTGTPATRSWASTASTATASSSAATCASSRGSSTTWPEASAPRGGAASAPRRPGGATRLGVRSVPEAEEEVVPGGEELGRGRGPRGAVHPVAGRWRAARVRRGRAKGGGGARGAAADRR